MLRPQVSISARSSMLSHAKRRTFCGNLAKINAPTLVLVGEGDPACTIESAEMLHSGIQGSELLIIQQAAHLPNIEQRERFNEVLVGFLDRQQWIN